MPFFIVLTARWRFGAEQQKSSQMKKKNRTMYFPPTVETLSAKVESGLQVSGGGNATTSQYGTGSWDNSQGAATSQYGTGSWDNPPQFT